ncbi:hypothetical protein DFH28DRAFT_888596 [Melampsora americana]|nr:hypothetical protein DFH28DRAFT_888596 [Melampsora americana]
MGQQDKATRLASVNSAQRDNPNDSLACLGLTENESHLQGNVGLDQSQCTLPTLRNDNKHLEASNEEYHCLNTKSDNNRHIHDISNEDMSNLIDVDDQTDLITANQTPQKSINPTPDSLVSKSSTRPSVKKGYKYKSSAESQVKVLLTRNSDLVKSSITDLEDSMNQANQSSNVLGEAILSIASILKPKEDPRLLLSKEDQIKQAQLDAQLHSLKVESAQLDVDCTKRAMDMEYRVARGKFIAQVMAENTLTLEQAKEMAEEVFPSIVRHLCTCILRTKCKIWLLIIFLAPQDTEQTGS